MKPDFWDYDKDNPANEPDYDDWVDPDDCLTNEEYQELIINKGNKNGNQNSKS